MKINYLTRLLAICSLICTTYHAKAQYSTSPTDSTAKLQRSAIKTGNIEKIKFLQIDTNLNKARIITATTTALAAYTATMVVLDQTWYAKYPRVPFHFFDDNEGWLQIDKVGHAWTSYMQSYYTYQLYRWAGVKPKKAAWIGAGAGFLFQAGLETLDGFSEAWGASPGDIIANTAGSLLMATQISLWNEQRITLKFSSRRINYDNMPDVIRARTKELYGTTLPERLLKDYNGQSYWLSVNPSSFMRRDSRFPKWLNIAVGYGADGMLGAEQNRWELPDGTTYNYSQWQRYRQFYLSLDIDLTKIPTRHRWLKLALGLLNTIKIPAPTIEYNTKGEIKFHSLYW